jgi:two-component sensor histidine kinase
MADRAPRVLIIDDDEGFCVLVSRHLKKANIDAVAAHSATAGLASIRENEFDAVVLDHVLPEHDGLTLLQTLSEMPHSPPVIYLTGTEESRIAVAALKTGAVDYVIKDMDGDFLILLETAINSAMAAAAVKRAKEEAEAEVRKTRDEFKSLADERQLLLKEVNHRVSNSLQLIASLLHFQADVSKNADIKSALKEANGRVLAVARVHRSLYTSHDVRWVSLKDYLSTLVEDLTEVSASAHGGHTIRLSCDPLLAVPDVAVSIGIVTTELVLNALKHAYANKQGEVRVTLKDESAAITLTVEDDGVGPGNGGQGGGLGKRIIAGMADKLETKLEYDTAYPGTRATLRIPSTPDIRLAADENAAV